MAHQVFVSHATEDLDTAIRVCKVLEADGTDCWLANRDVEAGTDYAAAILDAIKDSQLVLLIFSRHANTSPYVLREIERAIAYDRPVLSLRLDDAVPSASMEYYLNLWQWLDAHAGVERQSEQIVAAVRDQLNSVAARSADVQEDSGGRAAPETGTRSKRNRRIWAIAAAVMVLILAAAAVGIWAAVHYSGAQASSGTPTTTTTVTATSSSVIVHVSNTWTELKPEGTLPPSRYGGAMVYHPSSRHLIMFGGYAEADVLNDTWAYDPATNAWTNLSPSGTVPPARMGLSMVYVPSIRRLIMFGGNNFSGDLNDTWAYDPATNAWTDLSPSGTVPHARRIYSLVYDPSSDRVIMFGGSTGIQSDNGAVGEAFLNDIWAYDPVANTWSKLRPRAPYPGGRGGHSMVYVPSTGKLIMFGGTNANGDLSDTWAYDPATNAWTDLSPSGTVPYARLFASAAYDSTSSVIVMFGGMLSGRSLNDTWAYDSTANSWNKISPVGPTPSPRGGQAMAYDPFTGQMIMFGGVYLAPQQDPGQRLNDTWAYKP